MRLSDLLVNYARKEKCQAIVGQGSRVISFRYFLDHAENNFLISIFLCGSAA
jgi:hypothetical protein